VPGGEGPPALALAFAANPASAQRRADIMRELPDLSGTSEKYEVVSVSPGAFLILEIATLRTVAGLVAGSACCQIPVRH
jgi:hypothetical protein